MTCVLRFTYRALWALFTIAATGCGSTSPTPRCSVPDGESTLVDETLTLVNEARAWEGLLPLMLNDTLSDAAGDYACAMIEREFFSHVDPSTKSGPSDRMIQAGYMYLTARENLATGYHTPHEVMSAWMDSPSHRANILAADVAEIGIAIRSDGNNRWYWVQEMAEPVLEDWEGEDVPDDDGNRTTPNP